MGPSGGLGVLDLTGPAFWSRFRTARIRRSSGMEPTGVGNLCQRDAHVGPAAGPRAALGLDLRPLVATSAGVQTGAHANEFLCVCAYKYFTNRTAVPPQARRRASGPSHQVALIHRGINICTKWRAGCCEPACVPSPRPVSATKFPKPHTHTPGRCHERIGTHGAKRIA
jgi:hypothetical protein